MLQPTTNTIYNAALYCRLSKDDGFSDRDSSSIENQREMLTRYCSEHGMKVYDCYVDDGYSGTNFDRPAFKRMIADIESGHINCVLTKDQSRLGRNHLEIDYYMEIFFPVRNIRYIAITDNVDTLNASSLDIAPFRNLLNDMYSQDVSKKVKSALKTRQMQGKFIGTKAPFGYKKDENDKNHLIIDERYAPVVRRIFDMYLDKGIGSGRIAKILTEEKVPRPYVAAAENFEYYGKYAEDENSYCWRCNTITHILQNPVYAGHIRGQYRVKFSHKSNKRKPMGSEQIIVKNTHEPIIDPERWETAQEIIKSHRVGRKDDGFDNVFPGLLKCPDCGHALTMSRAHRRSPRPDPIDMIGYQCSYYREFGKDHCTQHWIEARDLYETVLSDIKAHAQYAVENDKKMLAEIINKLNADVTDNIKETEKTIKKSKARLAELDKLFSALYEDKVAGNISDRNYKQLSANYEAEQIRLEQEITENEQTLRSIKVSTDNADTFVETIKQYADIDKLTSPLVHRLIDKIIVHTAEIIDGEKIQKIEIFYKFVGKLEAPKMQ